MTSKPKIFVAAFTLGFVSICVAQAQIVTVDLSKPVNILTSTSIGFPALMHSGDTFNAAGAPYLRTAGMGAPRYPGNHGVADLYHWSSKSLSKYNGVDAPYFAPESTFPAFALMAEKLGNAVVVVNYGSNLDGTGGASPAEAAAWVAYANGDPANTQAIVKDPKGGDWHTVGFWATIRGDTPLASDDGYNFLRISHPKPFGFRLWQIGDQVYNNGYLGGDRVGNPDLHGPVPTTVKDFAKLKKDPKLSPMAFGDNLKAFTFAMKAVDPGILIGVGLVTPPAALKGRPQSGGDEWSSVNSDDKSGPDWNNAVLKSACASIDFVSLDWETGNVLPPDYKTLDESNLFPDTKFQINGIILAMLGEYKGNCATGHTPRIALSSAQIKTWPRIEHPIVRAMWIADTYSTLLESGFLNIDGPEVYSDSMMSGDRKKFGEAFYGLQMLHIVARSPGDTFVDATSSSPQLFVHATRRQDGVLGILLVNADTKIPATVKISLKGGSAGAGGKRFDYGPVQTSQGQPPAATASTVSGSDFTVTVPPFNITDFLLPAAK